MKRRSSTLILNLWLKPNDGGRPDPTLGTMRYGISDVDPNGKGFTCYRAWIPDVDSPREYRYRIEARLMKVSIVAPGQGNIKVWDVHAKGDNLKTAVLLTDESDDPDDPNDAFSVDEMSEFEASVMIRMAQEVVKAYSLCKYANPHDDSFGGFATISIYLQKTLVDLVEMYSQQVAGELRSNAGYPHELEHPGHQVGSEERTDIATADRWDRIQHEHGPEDSIPCHPDTYARQPLRLHDDDYHDCNNEQSAIAVPAIWRVKYGFQEEEQQEDEELGEA
jgi:hypothetical protein